MDITAQCLATLAPGQKVVPGRVELLTATPIVLPRQVSLWGRLAELHGRQPWILPTFLLSVLMAGMLGRRTGSAASHPPSLAGLYRGGF